MGIGGEGERRREASDRGSSHCNTGSRRDRSRPGLCVRFRPERDFPEWTTSGESVCVCASARPACVPLLYVPDWIAVCVGSALNGHAHVCVAACVASVGCHRFLRETVFWSVESLPSRSTPRTCLFLLLTLPIVSCDTRFK